MIIDFSRAYWYMVTAAVAALVGAALNVLRIYEESVDEDQQRLIPEELRYEFIMPKIIKTHLFSDIRISLLRDHQTIPSRRPMFYVNDFFLFCILVIMFPKNESFKFFSSYSDSIFKNCK